MSAAWLRPDVKFDPGTAKALAEFEIRNDSGEVWKISEGFAVGYQIFDAETGTLIVDGARTAVERDLKPGESAPMRIGFETPREDGAYQVIVSPVRESVCWYWERGWPFLLADISVRAGVSRLERVRVATRSSIRRALAVRSLGRAFVYPVRTIWRNRGLIRVMVRRDILGRYRGSFAGTFWTLINPLLLMLTYFFVFGLVLGTQFPGIPGRSGFALHFLAGLLPWLAVSEAAGRAPSVMLEHRNFVKKLVFAVETLPVNLVVSGLVSELFALLLFGGVLAVLRGGVPATAIWLPMLLIPQILFTLGLSWFLAALGAFVRDLAQIIGFILTIWFFLTPICYPEASLNRLPHSVTLVLGKNPIYVLVSGYRAILLYHQAPEAGPLWKLWLLSAMVFVLGYACFHKLRKTFADIL